MSEDIPITTFHFGFLLTCAFASATMHLMLIVGQPDLTEAKEWISWKNHLRFLQVMMFLPLAGFFLSHVGAEPDAAAWFLGTLVVSAILYLPAERQLNQLRPKPNSQASNAHESDTSSTINAHKEIPEKVQKRSAFESAQMGRLLLANFCLGLVMGASIVAPMAVMVGLIKLANAINILNGQQMQWALALVPAITSLTVPILMPYLFLSLGPLIIQFTQSTEKVNDRQHHTIFQTWSQLLQQSQAANLKTNSRKLQLHIVPKENLSFSNAFFLGWPGRYGLLPSAIFLSSDLPKLLTHKQLQFVMAHELAHDIRAHAKRRVVKGLGIFLTFIVAQSMALMTGSIILSIAITMGVLVGAHYSFKHQSQQQELEADTTALSILGNTIDSCEAAESVVLLIESLNRSHPQRNLNSHMTTHPSLYARLQNIKNIALIANKNSSLIVANTDKEDIKHKKAA